jgi:hypothetical protein
MSRRHVSVSPLSRHESQTMRVSRVLFFCMHPTVHLERLELGKQLIHLRLVAARHVAAA